jgi:hypothetical protein
MKEDLLITLRGVECPTIPKNPIPLAPKQTLPLQSISRFKKGLRIYNSRRKETSTTTTNNKIIEE